jgi:hypothetical protein
MPLYASESLTIDQIDRMVKTHTCSCGANLTKAWGGATGHNCFMLRCANNIGHNTFHVKGQIDKVPENLRREYTKIMTTEIAKMNESQMLARVNQARFPAELSANERRLMAQIALQYELDPLMNELTIYQGRPYVTYDGRMRKAQETQELDGVETCPASKDEREAFELKPGDKLWKAIVYKKGSSRGYTGWGKVRAAETEAPVKSDGSKGRAGYRPTETNPDRMAEKRAEMFAIRKAFHLPLPTMIDGVSAGDEDEAEEALAKYNAETTIVEVKEVKETKKTEPGPAPVITSTTDLYKLCLKNYSEKFATSSDVLKFIGKTQADISDPAAEYAAIVEKLKGGV